MRKAVFIGLIVGLACSVVAYVNGQIVQSVPSSVYVDTSGVMTSSSFVMIGDTYQRVQYEWSKVPPIFTTIIINGKPLSDEPHWVPLGMTFDESVLNNRGIVPDPNWPPSPPYLVRQVVNGFVIHQEEIR